MILSDFQKSAVKKFNQRIHDGLISFQRKTCLCNANDFDTIFKYDRYGLWHPVVICKNCGLIQSNPQLSDEEYNRFYSSDDYRILYEGENYLEISKSRYKESNHIFDMLFPVMKELNLNTILEFGCGGGWNLYPFYKNGYAVTGYDYSFNLIKLGRSYGLNLRQGSFAEINSTSDKYDVIILNHVIEHFTDFFNNMASILQHLNTKGILYVGVPNIDNFRKGQFQNVHIYYFSPRTFNYYMKICGLEVLKFGPSEKIHMYGILKRKTIVSIEKNQLSHEYALMKQKIVIGKLTSALVSLLEKIGIKKPVKSFIDFLKNRKPK
jgi:2-polyprenyl-3-methyl-5-hydroxy-6-metoxy-1,4-benzoquinol methylase